ncbi:hypothetical protein [Shivajiella indica]|uniref:Uncharacterized protein n=1 Tax=Shivajiella indica TaxID=872115 RepID=A0ABW5BD10_9BACT
MNGKEGVLPKYSNFRIGKDKQMTDDEFDLLDELYFVQHFDYLKDALGWEDQRLLTTLQSLHEKSFIKCLIGPDDEIFSKVNFLNQGKQLYYLATKKGLMEHNAL